MHNVRNQQDHSYLAELERLEFPTNQEGEAMKFVYLRTPRRSLTFPLFHVFMRVVRVQLFLLDEALVFNNYKLLP